MAMPDTPFLSIEGLEVVYQRAITALHGVDLKADEGRITAILGNNGAGKTTTLRAISGFIGLDQARVTKGSIRFKGHDLRNQPPYRISTLGITIVPERNKIFPNLSVAENLAVVVSNKSATERRRAEEQVYEYFPRLGSMRNKEGGLLSGGERQMLGVGAALVCGPELLLIDELSLGLAPAILEELAERLERIQRETKLTILLVEQNAAIALRIAHEVYVLENGRTVLHGTPAELRGNRDIQDLYLGTSRGKRLNYNQAARERGLQGS
jgi:branched-chain amino acid transport system ATP-binding protein